MRDINRIPSLIDALVQYWERNPDLRLGQIVCNANNNEDPFYMEDDQLEGYLDHQNATYRDAHNSNK